MSDYTHRMSLAVPKALMTQAFSDMGLTIIGTDEVRYAHIGLSETYNGLIA